MNRAAGISIPTGSRTGRGTENRRDTIPQGRVRLFVTGPKPMQHKRKVRTPLTWSPSSSKIAPLDFMNKGILLLVLAALLAVLARISHSPVRFFASGPEKFSRRGFEASP